MLTSLNKVEVRRHTAANPWTYADLDRHQRGVADEVRAGGAGRLLLSEVAPVITYGRRTPPADVFSRDIETYAVDRGGLATYHGPGQWVVFPVESLERLTGSSRGVRIAVEGLLEVACAVSRVYCPDAEIRTGAAAGVWSRGGKLASVGIHIEKGVLLHGFALNVHQTAQSFQGLRPCGMDVQPAFLEADFETVGRLIVQEMQGIKLVPDLLARSSAGEHHLDTVGVVGSIPIAPTIFPSRFGSKTQ